MLQSVRNMFGTFLFVFSAGGSGVGSTFKSGHCGLWKSGREINSKLSCLSPKNLSDNPGLNPTENLEFAFRGAKISNASLPKLKF